MVYRLYRRSIYTMSIQYLYYVELPYLDGPERKGRIWREDPSGRLPRRTEEGEHSLYIERSFVSSRRPALVVDLEELTKGNTKENRC